MQFACVQEEGHTSAAQSHGSIRKSKPQSRTKQEKSKKQIYVQKSHEIDFILNKTIN